MEGVTLLESGAARLHFAFVKRLELAKSAVEADEIVYADVQSAIGAITSRRAADLSEASLSPQLLVLLHAAQVYPHADGPHRLPLDLTPALVPALHLLATARRARGLQIAYSTLALLFGPSSTSKDATGQQSDAPSLLLLNTIRQHLAYTAKGVEGGQGKGKGKVRRPSVSTTEGDITTAFDYARKHLALRSIVGGMPSGPDAVSALYGPVASLLSHHSDAIRSLAIRALLSLTAYKHEDDDRSTAQASWDRMRDAATHAVEERGKGRHGEASECLQRALIKSARNALSLQALHLDDYIDAVLSFASTAHASVWLSMSILRALRVTLVDHQEPLAPSTVDRIAKWALDADGRFADSYPHLVEIAQLSGALATSPPSERRTTLSQTVWSQGRAHLLASNANRRIVALIVLEAMLPYEWPAPSSPYSVSLQENEMEVLMDLLSNGDATIRAKALTLFYHIDPNIPRGHAQALKRAKAELEAQSTDTEDVDLRIAEVTDVLARLEGPLAAEAGADATSEYLFTLGPSG